MFSEHLALNLPLQPKSQVEQIIPPARDETAPPPSKKKKPLFSFLPVQQAHQNHSPAHEEVETYLKEPIQPMDSNALQYWSVNRHKFPNLSKVALRYLCIPATSAPVERIFSVTGKIFRPECALLSDSVFQNLMFAKCNWQHIKDN